MTSSVLVKRKSSKVRMDPSQDPTAAFFSGLNVGTVNNWCTKRSERGRKEKRCREIEVQGEGEAGRKVQKAQRGS